MKNKDLILKRMIDIDHKKEEDLVLATLAEGGKQAYLSSPFLDEKGLDASLEKLKPYDSCYLVVYNTKENLEAVIKAWDGLVKFKRGFSIIFVNPFSRTEKKWSVYPATHDLVTERPKLKQSLKVLFLNVEETTEQEIGKIIKEQ